MGEYLLRSDIPNVAALHSSKGGVNGTPHHSDEDEEKASTQAKMPE